MLSGVTFWDVLALCGSVLAIVVIVLLVLVLVAMAASLIRGLLSGPRGRG